MATFTASEAFPGVIERQNGIIAKTSLLTMSTTATASSVFLLCKVPDGAQIVDFILVIDSGGANPGGEIGVLQPEGSVSWTLSQSAIGRIASDATIRPTGINLPYTISIPSECQTRWAWITAVYAGDTSASLVLKTTVFYTMDGS